MSADTKTCEQCGEPFARKPRQGRTTFATRRFCSVRCDALSKRKAVPACEVCGQPAASPIARFCAGHTWDYRRTPEYRERQRATRLKLFADRPDVLARVQAAATRNVAKIDRAQPYRRKGSYCAGLMPEERKRYDRLARTTSPKEARATIDRERLLARAAAQVDDAARFLRRLAPVIRCDALGRMSPSGTHFRFSSKVLTPAALAERAVQKGWRPADHHHHQTERKKP